MNDDKLILNITGMHCASCATTIQKSLMTVKGVTNATVNFATRQAVVIMDPHINDAQALIDVVNKSGYSASLSHSDSHELIHDHGEEKHAFRLFLLAAIFTLPLVLPMILMTSGIHYELPPFPQAILASIVLFIPGRQFFKSFGRLFHTKTADMDLLIAIGAIAAWGLSIVVWLFDLPQSLYFESTAMIISLILFGRWLESKTRKKASMAIQQLLNLKPSHTLVLRGNSFVEIPVDEIMVDDIFKVLPGDKIAADGIVIEGSSKVDESMLTGESFPVDKKLNSQVYAATLNLDGALQIKAQKIGAETYLSEIIAIVENAQNSKAPMQRLADTVASVFVPLVIILSLLTLFGWLYYSQDAVQAVINAVCVLVIACPCALGLATPTVIMKTSGLGAKLGILFKDANVIENIGKINIAVFDKTGTITVGQPKVVKSKLISNSYIETVANIVLTLESNSKHPVASALKEWAALHSTKLLESQNFLYNPGKGLSATINGSEWFLGSLSMAQEAGIDNIPLEIENWETEGFAICLLWHHGLIDAAFAIGDPLRSNVLDVMSQLSDRHIETMMLSGDRVQAAEKVAQSAHITHFKAGVLPQEKAVVIDDLKKNGKNVAMIGDGINDAPALAAANVGVAMASGSDIAISTADITLMRSDLASFVQAILLSRQASIKMRENLFLAFIYNFLAIPMAAFGLLTPPIAAAAMSLSSLSVVLNALFMKSPKSH